MDRNFDGEDEFSDETTSETGSVITADEESEELLAEATFDASEDSNDVDDEEDEIQVLENCSKCGEEFANLLTINDIKHCQACVNKIQVRDKAIKESSKCRVVLDRNDVHDYIGNLQVAVSLQRVQVPKTIHEASSKSNEPEIIVLDDDDDDTQTENTAAEPAKTIPAEPTRTKSIEAEPAATQPAKAESTSIQPARAESAATQPAKAESATTQPSKVESAATQPARAEPAATQPARAEPAATQPLKVELGYAKSAQPVVPKPEPVQPASSLQVDDKSKQAEEIGNVLFQFPEIFSLL